jgi:hypothetical protein
MKVRTFLFILLTLGLVMSDGLWIAVSSSSSVHATGANADHQPHIESAKRKKRKKHKKRRNGQSGGSTQAPTGGGGGGGDDPTPPPPCTIGGYCYVNQANRHGWWFPSEGIVYWGFNGDDASIGNGSVWFEPLGPSAIDQFIAWVPGVNQVSDLVGLSYDYKMTNGDPADVNRFYVLLWVDQPENGIGTLFFPGYYDCQYAYLPSGGNVGQWKTVTPNFSNPDGYGGAGSCPSNPGGLSAGTQIIQLSLNAGEETAHDDGLEGRFDNVVVTTPSGTTTYDFEP